MLNQRPTDSQPESPNSADRDLDDKDLQIIAALQINGRTSYAELAEGIELSQAAIRLRVNRLLESGIVEIVAITDPLSIGFTVVAMIGLTAEGDVEALSDEIGARKYAVYVVLTAGRFDLRVEVLCADNDHLLEVMSDLRGLDGVSSVEAHTYLRLTKQTYAWGIPPHRERRNQRGADRSTQLEGHPQ